MEVNLPKGECEYYLASGDKPDVIFLGKTITVAVEVKSRISNDADLQRGVYQCVKYRAVIRAEQKARKEIPNGLAMLVTESVLPPSVLKLAELFDIPFRYLDPIFRNVKKGRTYA